MMDKFNRKWIIENSVEVVSEYEKGILTIRGLYYRLVARGMTNTHTHYMRVAQSLGKARRDGIIEWDVFADNDREMLGDTLSEPTNLDDKVSEAKVQLRLWMNSYYKNRWENQPYHPEVLIEKKALQGTFRVPCSEMDVAVGACKGYPSLTFLFEMAQRFRHAKLHDKQPIVLYFGDYDPTGEDIPRSIEANMLSDFGIQCEVRRIALMEHQVTEWQLPPAPIKKNDSRAKAWEGLGQVELDAVLPQELQRLCRDSIAEVFNEKLYDQLLESESTERVQYQKELKEYFKNLTE